MGKPIIRTIFLLFTLLLIFSCRRDAPLFKIDNLNGGLVSVYGHAGMGYGFQYPIDTYESIEPLLRIGADGSELDIQMTKDSVLVVFHDKYLEDRTPCATGLVNDKLWSEIAGCHIACPISSSVNLISFDELIEKLVSSGKNIRDYVFTFDCKIYTNTADIVSFYNQYANAILRSVDQFNLADKILIESQDTAFLRVLKNKRDGLKLFIYPPDFEKGLQAARNMGLYGITISANNISSGQIKEAHLAGFRISLWGIDTHQGNIDAVMKSPDFVQTDKPIHLLKVFGRYKE